ncbi:MAG: hypothetical protein HFJ49_03060 [Clostridia bacterium]|jgi:hypothetical protein|nr:hypothetical protein [Clostridia bacterium]
MILTEDEIDEQLEEYEEYMKQNKETCDLDYRKEYLKADAEIRQLKAENEKYKKALLNICLKF